MRGESVVLDVAVPDYPDVQAATEVDRQHDALRDHGPSGRRHPRPRPRADLPGGQVITREDLIEQSVRTSCATGLTDFGYVPRIADVREAFPTPAERDKTL
jgi:hypothetical protein